MQRRDFMTLVGAAAVMLPLAARAQKSRMTRVGILATRPDLTGSDSRSIATIGIVRELACADRTVAGPLANSTRTFRFVSSSANSPCCSGLAPALLMTSLMSRPST